MVDITIDDFIQNAPSEKTSLTNLFVTPDRTTSSTFQVHFPADTNKSLVLVLNATEYPELADNDEVTIGWEVSDDGHNWKGCGSSTKNERLSTDGNNNLTYHHLTVTLSFSEDTDIYARAFFKSKNSLVSVDRSYYWVE